MGVFTRDAPFVLYHAAYGGAECPRNLALLPEARFLRRLRPALFGPFRDLSPQPAAPHAPWPGDLDGRLSEGSESTFRCPRPDIDGLAPRQKPA